MSNISVTSSVRSRGKLPPKGKWQNKFLSLLSRELFSKLWWGIKNAEIRKILVYRPGGLGDILVATPAFRAIRNRFPRAELTLLTFSDPEGHSAAKELLGGLGIFDEIMDMTWLGELLRGPKKDRAKRRAATQQLLNDLRAAKFNLAVKLPNDREMSVLVLRDLLLARYIGIERGVGFRIVTRAEDGLHQVDRLLRIVAELGEPVEHNGIEIPVGDDDRQFAEEVWRGKSIQEEDLVVAVYPGGDKPANRWPIDRFAEVLAALSARHAAKFVLVGGPRDLELVRSLEEQLPKQSIFSTAGKTTLLQLAAILGKCSLFFGNDGGPMHIAAAMGVPVLAIFSGRDMPYKWYPYGTEHVVVRSEKLPCSPCFRYHCDSHECMTGISTEEVITGAEELMQRIVSSRNRDKAVSA